MHRVLPVLLLVVVAGCSGGLPSGSPATGPPDTAWTDGDRINATSLARQHFGRLRAAGSFTRNHTDRISVSGTARPEGYYPPSITRERVHLDAGRYLGVFITAGERRTTTFISPTEKATRRKPCTSDACAYDYSYQQRAEGALSKRIDRYRTAETVASLADRLDQWNFTYTDTVTREGTTLHRYTADRTLDHPIPVTDDPPRARATLLVTADGVIRRFAVRYVGTATVPTDDGETSVAVSQRFTVSYTAVGATTVERPSWVARAAGGDPPPTTATSDT